MSIAPTPLHPVRVLRLPLDAVVTDFLLHHDGDPASTPTPKNDAVLRQPSLPSGATVAYARVEDPAAQAQLDRLTAYIADLRAALTEAGVPIPDEPPAETRVLPAVLVVAVESATWKRVAVGEEPEHPHPVEWGRFGWPAPEQGEAP